MDQFIDNLSRELAKPTSRRGVIRLVGGAMLGSLVAAWKPASLEATNSCPSACNSSGDSKKCCKTGSSPFCIHKEKTCCGNSYCSSGYKCCGSGSSAHCCTQSRTCCGKDSCDSDETCCNNKTCCSKYQQCHNGCCVASYGKK